MTWFRVDDSFYSHPKVLELLDAPHGGLEAVGLWMLVGSWCADQLTDGAFPSGVVRRMGGTPEIAGALVDAGLWERVAADGAVSFRFRDWLDWNPSRDGILAKREHMRELGRRGGAARTAPPTAPPSVALTVVPSAAASSRPVPSRPVQETAERVTARSVVVLFSDVRARAGRGRYVAKSTDQELAEGVLAWARSEAAGGYEALILESAASYLRHGDEWCQKAGYPFRAWAMDPGRWLSAGRSERRPVPMQQPHETQGTPATPEEVRALLGSILSAQAQRSTEPSGSDT